MINQLKNRLQAQRTVGDAAQTVLRDIIALHGAEYGNLQMPVRGELVIVAQSGLSAPFLRTFKSVTKEDSCACGRAYRSGTPVIVVDVDVDPDFAPYREAARQAGYRSVQSTPLMTKRRKLVGMVSTLFAQVHRPTKIEMEILAEYSVLAAEHFNTLALDSNLAEHAKRLNAELYAEIEAIEEPVFRDAAIVAERNPN